MSGIDIAVPMKFFLKSRQIRSRSGRLGFSQRRGFDRTGRAAFHAGAASVEARRIDRKTEAVDEHVRAAAAAGQQTFVFLIDVAEVNVLHAELEGALASGDQERNRSSFDGRV